MATIVTASPLNLDQLIKRKNVQKDESTSKEKDGKTSGYTSGTPTQRAAYMAPRPGYGIPLGDISPMAKIDNSFHWRDITGIKADENTRKYLAQYEASRPGTVIKRIFVIYREIAFFRERAAARERERQREEEERANRRAKAEKERKRSHGRERKNEQRRQAKRKTEMKMAFKERERRWQHREETMATNRE
ncbi:hypothetical protein RhiirA1_475597, partial [Rhizophagus irregularis]